MNRLLHFFLLSLVLLLLLIRFFTIWYQRWTSFCHWGWKLEDWVSLEIFMIKFYLWRARIYGKDADIFMCWLIDWSILRWNLMKCENIIFWCCDVWFFGCCTISCYLTSFEWDSNPRNVKTTKDSLFHPNFIVKATLW